MTPADLVDRYSTLVVAHAELRAERDALREALVEAKRYVCQTFPDETNRLEICRQIHVALERTQ